LARWPSTLSGWPPADYRKSARQTTRDPSSLTSLTERPTRHASDTSGHASAGLQTHLDSHANRRCPARSTYAPGRTKTRARDVSVALLMAAARHIRPKRRTHRAETPRARHQNHSGASVPVSGLLQFSRSSWNTWNKPIWVVWCSGESRSATDRLSHLSVMKMGRTERRMTARNARGPTGCEERLGYRG
jgi:hypothetical protein